MSEDDIYIRVDEPDTEFTTEEWNNYRDIPTHEQAVKDGKLFVKRLLISQLKAEQEGRPSWIGFARARKNDGKGDKFKGNAHIKDVGKVVPKIIKEQLTRAGKWESVTKKRYIRLRQKG